MTDVAHVEVKTASGGFYTGFNKTVAITSKIIMGLFILWAAIFPSQANEIFQNAKAYVNSSFGTWYMYIYCPDVCIVLFRVSFMAGCRASTPRQRS